MRKMWVFFALVPLFSYAAIQEEWLSESSSPVELKEKQREERNSETLDKSHSSPSRTGVPQRLKKYRKNDAAVKEKTSARAARVKHRKHPLDEMAQSPDSKAVQEPKASPEPTSKKPSEKSRRAQSNLKDRVLGKDVPENFQERETPPRLGMHIETNRKPSRHAYLTQESQDQEDDTLIEQEPKSSQAPTPPCAKENPSYRYKAKERISAEADKRSEEMSLKRKSESSVKSSRRSIKELE